MFWDSSARAERGGIDACRSRGDARAGVDLSEHQPPLLTRELAEQADIVVTLGCGDQRPFIPGKRYVDWDLPDPKGRPIAEVRATREEIAKRVRDLLDALDKQ